MKRIIFIGLVLVVAVLTGLYLTNKPTSRLTPKEKIESVNAG